MMEFDLFSVLGLILGTWVLISPGWRLYGLRSQHSALKEPLLEVQVTQAGNRAGINLWLPSWFLLSVADPMYWVWFFSYASSITVPADETLLWSDLNESIGVMILLTIVINTGLLVWVCILDHKKILVGLAAVIAALTVISGLTLLWKGQSRLYIIGSIAVVLTSVSNICRIMSVDRPQFSKLAMSVAIAGAIAGILWIPRELIVHRVTADATKSVWGALFKKNFFWKVSSATGSIFRGRDVVFMVRLAGGTRNAHQAIGDGWSWLRQRVAGSVVDASDIAVP